MRKIDAPLMEYDIKKWESRYFAERVISIWNCFPVKNVIRSFQVSELMSGKWKKQYSRYLRALTDCEVIKSKKQNKTYIQGVK